MRPDILLVRPLVWPALDRPLSSGCLSGIGVFPNPTRHSWKTRPTTLESRLHFFHTVMIAGRARHGFSVAGINVIVYSTTDRHERQACLVRRTSVGTERANTAWLVGDGETNSGQCSHRKTTRHIVVLSALQSHPDCVTLRRLEILVSAFPILYLQSTVIVTNHVFAMNW